MCMVWEENKVMDVHKLSSRDCLLMGQHVYCHLSSFLLLLSPRFFPAHLVVPSLVS